MCVIIITNPEHPITREELRDAWTVNDDGAGLAYLKHGVIRFKRGYMNFNEYWQDVDDIQHRRDLMLHLRISTGAGVNKKGTHPYKASNVLKLEGRTREPVIAMNGVIYGQSLDKKAGVKLNDTASYIKDHAAAFKALNADILDIIGAATGAKWSAVTTGGIITTSDFIEHDGRQYSNLNHLTSAASWLDFYDYGRSVSAASAIQLIDLLDADTYASISADWPLYDELDEYRWNNCKYWRCSSCNGCISDIKTKKDARQFLINNQCWEF